jgi:DNA topoisomerase III
MHSYADRFTHDFFFERDYPKVAVLDAIFARLRPEPIEKAVLQKQMRIDPDVFDKALEKLWTNGGAVLDYAENVSAGHGQWRESYNAQGEQKRAQLDQIVRYAEANQCRMSTLVRHFGDLADGQTACGICDFCAPSACAAQRFRIATVTERAALFRALAALRSGDHKATGRLYTELFAGGEISRDVFEDVLGAMARAGLAQLSDASFEKDGRQIPYRTVQLTSAGRAADETTPLEFLMKDTAAQTAKGKRKKKTTAKGKQSRTAAKAKDVAAPKAKRSRTAAKATKVAAPKVKRPSNAAKVKKAPTPKAKRSPAGAGTRVEEALRAWRLTEARRLSVPAFRIFTDQTLRGIAEARPATAAELLAIPGMGIRAVEKYGRQIYRILEGAS